VTTLPGRRTKRLPVFGVVGAGRAGGALAVGFRDAGYSVAAISSRDRGDAERLAQLVAATPVGSAGDVAERCDIVVLAVPDPAIAEVAGEIAAAGTALAGHGVVHCSARLTARELELAATAGADTGVLHPLQALAGTESAPLLRGAAFRVEATGRLRGQLDSLVSALGGFTIEVPEADLDLYHAAAVLAGNAPLALLARAATLLESTGVPPDSSRRAVAALMVGAATNAGARPIADALTGPVARGDADALERHMAALAADPAAQELYRLLVLDLLALRPDDVASGSPLLEVLRPRPATPRQVA
jgi:predicted short-subunit dehydrogenase-like oxidoreductase (DUF2520 family)